MLLLDLIVTLFNPMSSLPHHYLITTSSYSLDDKCALLTVLPFSMVLLSNLWNEDEYNDRRIFAYERDRGYFASPILSPLTSLIADIILYKLLPPICAALTLYPVLGLRSQLTVWMDFLTVMCLVQVNE